MNNEVHLLGFGSYYYREVNGEFGWFTQKELECRIPLPPKRASFGKGKNGFIV